MGLGCPGSLWLYQVPAFAEQFRVITLDNRGIGGTDAPDGDYTTQLFAQDVAGLLGELGIANAHVLGMSMGGAIAQQVALDYPALVDRLVLACTWCGTGRFGEELLGAW